MIFYYIMIFLFPFQDHPILSASIFGITIIKIAGIAVTLAALVKLIQGNDNFIASRKVIIPYFFFLFCYTLSFLFNDTTFALIVFPRLFSVSILLLTSSILLNSSKKIWRVLLIFLASMNISSLYVVRQYLFGVLRPGGTFGDANFYAIAGAFTAVLGLSLWAYQKQYRSFFLVSFILNTSGVLLSGSRGGFLALIVSMLFFWYKQKKKLIGALLLAFSLAALLFLVPNNMIERFEGEDYGANQSSGHRLQIIEAGWEMIKNNPVIGVGPGMFKIKTYAYFESHDMARMAHNSYLEVAAEFGVLGILAYLYLCYSSIRQLNSGLRAALEKNERMAVIIRALLVAAIGYFFGAIFLSVEYEKVLWLTISIASVSHGVIDKEKPLINSSAN